MYVRHSEIDDRFSNFDTCKVIASSNQMAIILLLSKIYKKEICNYVQLVIEL